MRQHFDADGDDTVFDEAEFFGGSDGDVDDPAFFVGAAIVDGDYLGFIVGEIDDADLGAHGEGFVGGGWSVVAKFLAAGGFGAVVGLDGIPGGFAFLGRFHDVWILMISQVSGATSNEDETCESQHRGLIDVPCV